MERLLADAQKLTGVEYNIDNLGDVYDAIHVIQGDLGLTGVAAAEASETFSGSFNAMKAAAQNFMGSLAIGENVSESLGTLMTSASTFFFGNFIPMLGTIIRSLPAAISTFFAQGIPVLLTNVSTLVTNFASSLTNTANGLTSSKVSQWAKTTLPKIIASAGKLMKTFASSLLKNMPKIVAAIGRIGAAIIRGLGSAIYGKVSAAAAGIRDRFLRPINALRDKVKGIIDKIKGFFSFNVSAPHIPLPHFSISPAGWKVGDLLKGVKPSLSVNWYDKGGVFTDPSIIGVAEKRPEFVGALDDLRNIVREESGASVNITNNIYGVTDPKKVADAVEKRLISRTKRGRLVWQ